MRTLLLLLAVLAFPVHADEAKQPQGSVKLQVWVSPEGTVTDAKVLSSNMPPEFQQQAVETVKKWKYKPQMKNGKAVASKGIQVITYEAEDK